MESMCVAGLEVVKELMKSEALHKLYITALTPPNISWLSLRVKGLSQDLFWFLYELSMAEDVNAQELLLCYQAQVINA